MDAWLIKRTLDRSREETSDFMQCNICGEFFNKCNLSEVFEHEHNVVETSKEYFGERK